MSSTVLALTLISVILISSATSEKTYIYAGQEQLNDGSFISWKDLRNEVRQGDAITYELGEPQYQILNADEPIEIITADQPGYYESLRRYDQAVEKPKAQRDESTTTQAHEKAELQHATEQIKAPVVVDDKKIKFIIYNSKKTRKNGSKKQVDEAKLKHAQHAALTVSHGNDHQMKPKKCKYNKLAENAQSAKLSTIDAVIDRPTLDNQTKETSTNSAVTDAPLQQSKKNQTTIIVHHFATSTTPQPTQETGMSEQTASTTQSTIITDTNHPIIPVLNQPKNEPITASSIEYKPLSAIPTPVKALSDSSSVFLVNEARVSDISSSYRNNNPEGLYAAKVNAKYPYYEAPPHIRDFEYLYRSALGMN